MPYERRDRRSAAGRSATSDSAQVISQHLDADRRWGFVAVDHELQRRGRRTLSCGWSAMCSSIRGRVGEGDDEASVARFMADQRTLHRVPHTPVCALLGVSLAWFSKWDRPGEKTRTG